MKDDALSTSYDVLCPEMEGSHHCPAFLQTAPQEQKLPIWRNASLAAQALEGEWLWNQCSETEGVAWLCVDAAPLQHLIGVTDEGADVDVCNLWARVTFPQCRSSSTGDCSVFIERFGECLTQSRVSVMKDWKASLGTAALGHCSRWYRIGCSLLKLIRQRK